MEACGHSLGVKFDAGHILNKIQIEMSEAREHVVSAVIIMMIIKMVMIMLMMMMVMLANTDPGVNNTELSEVGALRSYQTHVHIKLNTLQTQLGEET